MIVFQAEHKWIVLTKPCELLESYVYFTFAAALGYSLAPMVLITKSAFSIYNCNFVGVGGL